MRPGGLSCSWNLLTVFLQCEDELQPAAFAFAGRDRAAVDRNGVFDDRQPQSRAALFARSALVDAVEAFEDVRQVLLADADAVVGERDRALFGGVGKQPDEDVASAGICLLYTSPSPRDS